MQAAGRWLPCVSSSAAERAWPRLLQSEGSFPGQPNGHPASLLARLSDGALKGEPSGAEHGLPSNPSNGLPSRLHSGLAHGGASGKLQGLPNGLPAGLPGTVQRPQDLLAALVSALLS